MQRHHRRRRALALLAMVTAGLLIAACVWVALGAPGLRLLAGGTVAGRHLPRPRPLPKRDQHSPASIERDAENQAIDRTLAYTPYVRVAGSQHREIALTFDDGPGPYTPRVLSVLERHHVPGTFFEVGFMEEYFHASTSAILAHGDVIGDHTETHAPMSKLSPYLQEAQLLGQASKIARYGAPFPRLFRPPYGWWNPTTLALLHKYRMLMVLWTVDTNDYRRPGIAAIVRAAVRGARPGAIILLHDAGGERSETVAALPKIIAALRARGYKLVTVPKLLLDNPAPRNQQISALMGSGG